MNVVCCVKSWKVCVSLVFLSMLLVGAALWWWRGQCREPRPLMEQSFSLKESQDPLLMLEPPVDPNACLRKARGTFTHTVQFQFCRPG